MEHHTNGGRVIDVTVGWKWYLNPRASWNCVNIDALDSGEEISFGCDSDALLAEEVL